MDQKDSIPGRLWDIVTTLSENAQQAGLRKAQELGFDLEVGQIPFQETLINLSHNRDVLRDAIDRGRIVQLPLKLQYRLLAEATKVKGHIDALVSGSDAILPLENSVEDLSATIWQFNLQNLSDQVLSFDSKMNELKAQETQIKKVIGDARKLEKAISRLADLQSQAESIVQSMTGLTEEASSTSTKIERVLKVSEDVERSVLASASLVEEHEQNISRYLVISRDNAAEVETASNNSKSLADDLVKLHKSYELLQYEATRVINTTENTLEAAIKKMDSDFEELDTKLNADFFTLITDTTEQLTDAIANGVSQLEKMESDSGTRLDAIEAKSLANETLRQTRAKDAIAENVADFEEATSEALSANKERLDELEITSTENIEKHDLEALRLTEQLKELEERIRTSIERATGYTLFHSFQKRQIDLQYSKLAWVAALALCVMSSVGLSWFFIHSLGDVHQFNTLFFMKLSISLPLIFAITFCSLQYTKERRLEEEYAFKSNISISLEPYQKLVAEMVNHNDPSEKAKYTAFIISSINKVFTSPTGLVFDTEDGDGETANNLLKTAGSVAETLVKLKSK